MKHIDSTDCKDQRKEEIFTLIARLFHATKEKTNITRKKFAEAIGAAGNYVSSILVVSHGEGVIYVIAIEESENN